MDCIFCKIINGIVPCYRVYEDNDVLAFLDINPVTPGHVLIIPKKHILDLMEMDDNTLIKIIGISKKIADILTEKLGANGFTLIQNNGIAQEVKHFHLHVIPKYVEKKELSIEEIYNIIK